MAQTKRIEKDGIGLVLTDIGCFTYETSYVNTSINSYPIHAEFYKGEPLRIGNHKILRHGEDNLLPFELRRVLNENSLTPEILNKQAQLLWGQGPALYNIMYQDGQKIKNWISDIEVENWLKGWDYEEYLLKAVIELRHTNAHFTKVFRNKGARLFGEKAFVHHLEHISSIYARLEWVEPTEKTRNIIVGDFLQPFRRGLTSYPIWNKSLKNPVSIAYNSMYTYALDNDYALPSYYGSLNWIKLGSSIAKLISNYNNNSIAIKYHIKAPASYWIVKEQQIRDKCERENKEYTDKMLEKLKDTVFDNIANALAGIENAGKFINTDTFFDDMGGQYVEWKIEPLDQKIKDFIDAQINISKRAAFETTAGIGLHPALSNISADGNLPSGSEQLYAFKLYLLTGVDIPEYIVCKTINEAIRINFPNKNLKIGFYHDIIKKEQETSPNERIINN